MVFLWLLCWFVSASAIYFGCCLVRNSARQLAAYAYNSLQISDSSNLTSYSFEKLYGSCFKVSNTVCLPTRAWQKVATYSDLTASEETVWSAFPRLLFWQALAEFHPWCPTFYMRAEENRVRNFETFTVYVKWALFIPYPLKWALFIRHNNTQNN